MSIPNDLASLETSAVNRALDKGLSGEQLATRLRERGYRPAIQLSTIFEMAGGFMNPKRRSRTQQLFGLVRDLDPEYPDEIPGLLRKEVIKLKTGAAVLPWLKPLDQTATKLEVHKIAQGTLNEEAQAYIKGRNAEMRAIIPAQSKALLQRINMIEAENPGAFKGLRTFEDVWAYFEDQIADIIMSLGITGVSRDEAKELAHRLTEFPAIDAAVRANVYRHFILVVHRATPGYDKTYDYRHFIGASYASALVTCDAQVRGSAGKICPALTVLWGDDVYAETLVT